MSELYEYDHPDARRKRWEPIQIGYTREQVEALVEAAVTLISLTFSDPTEPTELVCVPRRQVGDLKQVLAPFMEGK